MKKDFTIPAVLLFFVGVPVLAHFPSDYDTAKAEAASVTEIYRADSAEVAKKQNKIIYEFKRSPEDRDIYTPDIDSTTVETDRY